MMIEMLDKFLYRPASLRYGVIMISFVLLGFITYYLLVIPFERQYQSEVRDYHNLLDEIRTLDNKLNNYPNSQQIIDDITNLEQQRQNDNNYSVNQLVKIISQRLIDNQLTVIDFHYQGDKDSDQLYFKIQGGYENLIKFINQLNKMNLTISITKISVIRQADNLIFLLSIAYQYKEGK